jgi:4-hydroxybutyryl-CoA dehydratase/vinylacetyl-CoA-Delta-isomerase
MAILTANDYLETLNAFTPEVFIRGERVNKVREHPLLKQTINHIAAGWELASNPENRGTFSAYSSLVDEDVTRIGHHIQTSLEDLTIKAKLTREVSGRRICAQCMSNMLSVTWAMIYDIDQTHGTDYFSRYQEFIKHLQRNGYGIAWGMMDPKGDRAMPPSKQKQPTDLRIIKRKPDGIIVRGAKLHTTYAPGAHEMMAVPCRALGEDDKDFAVSFAVPIDTQGIKLIARPSPGPTRQVSMESPLSSQFIGVECLTVFDDVFVPEERIFMCGEWEHTSKLPLYFAGLHRQSKCACSAGHTDLLIGLAALLADANGLKPMPSHIKDKITAMMMAASTAYGCALGAAMEGQVHPSGVFLPDAGIANSGLNYIRSLLSTHIAHIHDIAGGLLVTMPTEADWNNPELKPYIEDALAGSPEYTVEDRLKVMHLAQDLVASRLTGTLMGFTINAAGSPETNKIVVRHMYDLEKKVRVVKEICGIA